MEIKMNERIRELAREAGFYANPDVEKFEKFAELIVKECMEQIDKIRDGCEDDGEDQQALGADWAGLAVARHFGVDE